MLQSMLGGLQNQIQGTTLFYILRWNPQIKVERHTLLFHMSPHKMKFNIRYLVNYETTCVLENVPLAQVYTLAVPTEAFQEIPGNRWRVLLKQPATVRLQSLEEGEYLKIASQIPPSNPELDTETIYVERSV